MTTPDEPKFGGIPLQTPQQLAGKAISMILWGSSGCGKTTFAGTFPGRKLVLLYDEGGANVLTDRDDVIVSPMHAMHPSHIEKWKEFDPFGISKTIKEQGIGTVIVDSLTSLSDLTLRYGVDHAARSPAHARAGVTPEDPGRAGYGRRKTWTMNAVHNLSRTVTALGTNIVFILHEDSPVQDDKGNPMYISMTLGSDMPEKTALAVSEVWYMRDTGKAREIFVRPSAMRKPMKSRMFDTTKGINFLWDYDAMTHKGLTMEQLLAKWQANGYNKIPLPSGTGK